MGIENPPHPLEYLTEKFKETEAKRPPLEARVGSLADLKRLCPELFAGEDIPDDLRQRYPKLFEKPENQTLVTVTKLPELVAEKV